MLSKSNLALRLARFGFRDGWLYYRNKKGLARFRAWPHLNAECLRADEWRKMDTTQCDQLVREFWGNSHVFQNGIVFIPQREAFAELISGQSCMPWVVKVSERRLAYGCYHWRQLLATIPVPLLRCAGHLECDLFSALGLLQQVPAAMDLVAHNPMLATVLARHWEFPAVGRIDWDAVRQQVGKRRRNIIGWLGYPSSQAWLNALERIECRGVHGAEISTIKCSLTLLGDSEIGPYLMKVGGINHGLVEFLSDPLTRQWLEPHQLPQIAAAINYLPGYFRSINWLLGHGLIDRGGANALSRYKPWDGSLKPLLRYLKPHELPPAPRPASNDVVHLGSLSELIVEGDAMDHCVGSGPCLRAAYSGGISLYRVVAPVRATLAIFKGPMGDEGDQLLDIKGPRNVEIALEHIKQIAKAFSPAVDFDKWLNATPGERLFWWRLMV